MSAKASCCDLSNKKEDFQTTSLHSHVRRSSQEGDTRAVFTTASSMDLKSEGPKCLHDTPLKTALLGSPTQYHDHEWMHSSMPIVSNSNIGSGRMNREDISVVVAESLNKTEQRLRTMRLLLLTIFFLPRSCFGTILCKGSSNILDQLTQDYLTRNFRVTL